jgi:glycosyltransferase involved in cell wall biosynthesis
LEMDVIWEPLISVVIPAFNAERYIREAVLSALTQSHQNLEVVVVDDGSTDGTAAAIAELNDPRLRIISQKNRGVSAARNQGLRCTSGEYVAFLDADDYWIPGKLEAQVQAFNSREELVAVGTLGRYVSAEGRVLGIAGELLTEQAEADVVEGKLMPFPPGTIMFRRRALEAVAGFDETLASQVPGQVEDLYTLSRVAALGPITCLPHIFLAVRVHEASASARHYFSQREGIRFIGERRRAEMSGASLSWDAFRQTYRPSLHDRRRDVAAYCYRQAGLRFGERRLLSSLGFAISAGLLGPRYASKRILRHRPWQR